MRLHFIGYVMAGILVISSCNDHPIESSSTESNIVKARNLEQDELVSRGAVLVSIGGCNDCHTPKVFTATGMHLDSSRMLSGHPAGSTLPAVNLHSLQPGNWVSMAPDITAFVGPWGMSFAANLTPDSATGIGNLTDDDFINIFHRGKHFGQENGRPIMPPMPWFNLSRADEQDLRAIFAYLRSLPAINNRVPGPVSPGELLAGNKKAGS